MPGTYDLMVLIDADAPEERRSAALSEVEQMIASGGELVGAHDWGVRRLAFEIDHRPEAEYHLFQFRAGNDVLERLGQRLKIMDGVLRFRIIRLQGEAEPPPSPDRQERRPREEREPEGKVAARAAADAPAPDAEAAEAEAPAAEETEAPAAEAPAPE
ncbi:MAG: 30S ribosomal protein S6 [Thermoleophilaceae bacterium]